MVRSGDRLEITRYKDAVIYGQPPNLIVSNLKPREKSYGEKVLSRYISAKRSKQTFTRLVYANAYQWKSIKGKFIKPTLLTLTFKENIKEVKKANDEFTKFIKRLNYEITGEKISFLKYITVIEFQKRGAVHYHVLFFNYSYLPKKKLSEIWRQGFIKVERIKTQDIGMAISYLCKYMIKDLGADKLCGQKSYFASRDLEKPVIARNQVRNDFFLSLFKEDLETTEEFRKKFKSAYCGEFDYSVHNLYKNKNFKKGILDFEELFGYTKKLSK